MMHCKTISIEKTVRKKRPIIFFHFYRPYKIALISQNIGKIFLKNNSYEKARFFLLQAANLYEHKLGKYSAAAEIYHELSIHKEKIHKTRTALKYSFIAMKLYQKDRNFEMSSLSEIRCGDLNTKLGHFEYAVLNYETALIYFEKEQTLKQSLIIRKKLLPLYKKINWINEYVSNLEQLARLYEMNGNKFTAGYMFQLTGNGYKNYLNNLKRAAYNYYIAGKLFENLAPNKAARMNILCGDISSAMGDHALSLMDYHIASKQADNDLKLLIEAYSKSAQMNLALNHISYALGDTKKAIKLINDNTEFQKTKANLYLLLAKIYKKSNEEKKVISNLDTASALFADIKKYKKAARISSFLAEYWIRANEPIKTAHYHLRTSIYNENMGKFKKAGEFAQKCAEIYLAANDKKHATMSFYASGNLYEKAEMYEKALALYEKCYLLNIALEDKHKVFQISNKISKLKKEQQL